MSAALAPSCWHKKALESFVHEHKQDGLQTSLQRLMINFMIGVQGRDESQHIPQRLAIYQKRGCKIPIMCENMVPAPQLVPCMAGQGVVPVHRGALCAHHGSRCPCSSISFLLDGTDAFVEWQVATLRSEGAQRISK